LFAHLVALFVMRLSVLGQLLAGAGKDGVSYEIAIQLLGFTDGALLDDAIDAIAAHDGATLFKTIDRVIESGHDPRRFTSDMLERIRDLMIVDALKGFNQLTRSCAICLMIRWNVCAIRPTESVRQTFLVQQILRRRA
jgi:DNA polymerase III gamma/tau subunit